MPGRCSGSKASTRSARGPGAGHRLGLPGKTIWTSVNDEVTSRVSTSDGEPDTSYLVADLGGEPRPQALRRSERDAAWSRGESSRKRVTVEVEAWADEHHHRRRHRRGDVGAQPSSQSEEAGSTMSSVAIGSLGIRAPAYVPRRWRPGATSPLVGVTTRRCRLDLDIGHDAYSRPLYVLSHSRVGMVPGHAPAG